MWQVLWVPVPSHASAWNPGGWRHVGSLQAIWIPSAQNPWRWEEETPDRVRWDMGKRKRPQPLPGCFHLPVLRRAETSGSCEDHDAPRRARQR
eukprot:s1814_g13.t1